MPSLTLGRNVAQQQCEMLVELVLNSADWELAKAMQTANEPGTIAVTLQTAEIEVGSGAKAVNKGAILKAAGGETLVLSDPNDSSITISINSRFTGTFSMSLLEARSLSSNSLVQGYDTYAVQDKLQASAEVTWDNYDIDEITVDDVTWVGGMAFGASNATTIYLEPTMSALDIGGAALQSFTATNTEQYEGYITYVESVTLKQGTAPQNSKDTVVTVELEGTFRNITNAGGKVMGGVDVVKSNSDNEVFLKYFIHKTSEKSKPIIKQLATSDCGTQEGTKRTGSLLQPSNSEIIHEVNGVSTKKGKSLAKIEQLTNGDPTEVHIQLGFRLSATRADSGVVDYFEIWSPPSSSIFVTSAVLPNAPVIANKNVYARSGTASVGHATSPDGLQHGVNYKAGNGYNGAQTLYELAPTEETTVLSTTLQVASRKVPTGEIDIAVSIQDDELLEGSTDAADTFQALEVLVVASDHSGGWPKSDSGDDVAPTIIRYLTYEEGKRATMPDMEVEIDGDIRTVRGVMIEKSYQEAESFDPTAGKRDAVLLASIDNSVRTKMTLTTDDFKAFGENNHRVKIVARTRLTAAVAGGNTESQVSGTVVSDVIYLMEEPKSKVYSNSKGIDEVSTDIDSAGTQTLHVEYSDTRRPDRSQVDHLNAGMLVEQLAQTSKGNSKESTAASIAELYSSGNGAKAVTVTQLHDAGEDTKKADPGHSGVARLDLVKFHPLNSTMASGDKFPSEPNVAAYQANETEVSNKIQYTHEEILLNKKSPGLDGIAAWTNDIELSRRLVHYTDSRIMFTQLIVTDLNEGRERVADETTLQSERDHIAFASEVVAVALQPDSTDDIDVFESDTSSRETGAPLKSESSNKLMQHSISVKRKRTGDLAANSPPNSADNRLAGYKVDFATIKLFEEHSVDEGESGNIESELIQEYKVVYDADTSVISSTQGSITGIQWAESEVSNSDGDYICQDLYFGEVSQNPGPLTPGQNSSGRKTDSGSTTIYSNLVAVGTHSGNHMVQTQKQLSKSYTNLVYKHYKKSGITDGISIHTATPQKSNSARFWTYPVVESMFYVKLSSDGDVYESLVFDINTRNAITSTEANGANADLAWGNNSLNSTPINQHTPSLTKDQDVTVVCVKKETVVNPNLATSIIDNALAVFHEALVVNTVEQWGKQASTSSGRGLPGPRSSNQRVVIELQKNDQLVKDQFVDVDFYVFVNVENARSILCSVSSLLDTSIELEQSGVSGDSDSQKRARHDIVIEAVKTSELVVVPDNQSILEAANKARKRASVMQ